MINYHFDKFYLTFNPSNGETFTYYPNGKRSGCGLVEGDFFHAPILGITPELHRLQHELAHHLIGQAIGKNEFNSCDIIFRDAHGIEQPQPESDLLEWMITALQYHSCFKHYPSNGYGALMDMHKLGINPYKMANKLNFLIEQSKI